ncbi:MAG TPA: hypothetical protein VGA89_02640 [Patescibacteria group bacterium]|jgi:hypothetical protein
MSEQNDKVMQNEAKKEKFKNLMSSVSELSEKVGIGSHEILEKNRQISKAVARALDKGITNVYLINDSGSWRIRVNLGAKADFIIKRSGDNEETYHAGADKKLPERGRHFFEWRNKPGGSTAGEIWDDPEVLDILLDTVYALTAVYDIKKATKEEKAQPPNQ